MFHGEFVNNLPKVAIINAKVYYKPDDNSLFTAVASNVNNFQTVFNAASLLCLSSWWEWESGTHKFLCSSELFQFTTHNKSSAQKLVVFQTNKCSSRTKTIQNHSERCVCFRELCFNKISPFKKTKYNIKYIFVLRLFNIFKVFCF